MSKLIKKFQGSGKLYQYNLSDNTYVKQPPIMLTYSAYRLKQKQKQQQKQLAEQKKRELKKEKYNKELNIARNALKKLRQEQLEAFELIRSGRYHNKMDKTTRAINAPLSGPTTTYQLTPEEKKVNRPVYGYDDPAGEVMLGLITAPFGGSILKTAGKKLLTTRFGRRLLYDIAANEAFNGIYSGITDGDFASDVNYIFGLDENNIFGDLASFSLSSSGRKALGKAMYKGFTKLPLTKRAIEVAMSQSSFENGYYNFLNDIQYRHYPLYKARNRAKLKYILKGELPDDDRLVFGLHYTGVSGHPHFPRGLVLAFIYGEKLDPQLATFKGYADEVKPKLHDDYIERVYPHKRSKILVYEVGPTDKFAVESLKLRSSGKPEVGSFDYDFPSKSKDYQFNVQGHLTAFDPATNTGFSSDIWKFEPEEYWKKWIESKGVLPPITIQLPKIGPFLFKPIEIPGEKVAKAGLRLINDVGNPIVLETTPITLE